MIAYVGRPGSAGHEWARFRGRGERRQAAAWILRTQHARAARGLPCSPAGTLSEVEAARARHVSGVKIYPPSVGSSRERGHGGTHGPSPEIEIAVAGICDGCHKRFLLGAAVDGLCCGGRVELCGPCVRRAADLLRGYGAAA